MLSVRSPILFADVDLTLAGRQFFQGIGFEVSEGETIVVA